ncbi:LysR family transcriptional regulator [Stutzerimonas kirkiae]|uniref:LysR family transcriptional regulator n=1 Tax=Stutzerimonas kirkiae TaxID=2211392 RepID=A0A4Q9R9Y7_9GAMM|nr:LysR family transcriptional regulator [Stutzerimonas kirkiae]TBU96594.1 LysR family transcriptional regulator [Stutzerimonas kirkiae]TBV02123.1 LysR family transcriptional regulator [Stutzerimonas kirkiae]
MNLTDLDLRLLRVFLAVVEARGISNAQAILGRDASTISKQISQLETRLGFRLCERGRSGFTLTEEGASIHRRAQELFAATRRFEQDARALSNQLSGPIRIAMIDNLITDPGCPLVATLERFSRREHNQVELFLDITAPARIEQAVLDQQADLGIGIFLHELQELDYLPLYREQDLLYASSSHPAASLSGERQKTALHESRKVVRDFLEQSDLVPLDIATATANAWVGNVEAAAMLILAGGHVGFLPAHYARHWVEQGQLVAIAPERYQRTSQIKAVTRQNKRRPRPPLQALLDDLREACASRDSCK